MLRHLSGARQRLVLHVRRRLPKPRPHQRFLALVISLLYIDRQYVAGRPAVDGEAGARLGIDQNFGTTADANGFTRVREQENNADLAVGEDIAH